MVEKIISIRDISETRKSKLQTILREMIEEDLPSCHDGGLITEMIGQSYVLERLFEEQKISYDETLAYIRSKTCHDETDPGVVLSKGDIGIAWIKSVVRGFDDHWNAVYDFVNLSDEELMQKYPFWPN